jgi:Holliday junction DNA helicase RuvA
MIGYIQGSLLKKEAEKILLLANQVGYEILLPAVAMNTVARMEAGSELCLYIYYYQTERQPRPVLIGFHSEKEKDFFQLFISVEAIGPLKAVKALTIPVADIAMAIENRDTGVLKGLPGIGNRTAQKIIATLEGKVERFMDGTAGGAVPGVDTAVSRQVLEVLVSQLGHKNNEARELVRQALKRKPDITTAEQLFDEVYRGSRT